MKNLKRIHDFRKDLNSLLYKYGFENMVVFDSESDEVGFISMIGEMNDEDVVILFIDKEKARCD